MLTTTSAMTAPWVTVLTVPGSWFRALIFTTSSVDGSRWRLEAERGKDRLAARTGEPVQELLGVLRLLGSLDDDPRIGGRDVRALGLDRDRLDLGRGLRVGDID